MAREWEIDGPRVLDIGDEHERVRELSVGIVGGHVDVVTHDDSPTARLEVHSVEGKPLRVTWDGHKVKVAHVKNEGNLWEALKSFASNEGKIRQQARISLSVPQDTVTSVSTVSADAVVSGIHADTKLNSVSGDVTAEDLAGSLDLNTVSGSIEGQGLRGSLKANTVSGSITVHGSQVDPISLNSVSGDITLDLDQTSASIKSTSVSGNVTLRFQPGSGYDVSVSTVSGAAVVDGRDLRLGPGKRGGGQLREGDGSVQIKANSVSGDVVVLRRSDNGTTAPLQQQDDQQQDDPQQDDQQHDQHGEEQQ